ncbi:PD-(D/E)XK motif protein [Chitinophaga flava]|uniref:PD-(D/E)XK motif protein n=1 Tax=Chitinophaga flava TaxID=2259036 RepID=A0A365Y5Y8_9BACT|nr:PD-(D/E)XK motif protein [Chitinophaga flava]RBL93305.1 PD-(D/E)XK motif protein [Chitinophaga flava]
MKRIQEIWQSLHTDKKSQPGLDKIRYSEDLTADLYLGIKYPESYRILLLRTETSYLKHYEIKETKGIRLEKISDGQSDNKTLLLIILIDDNLREIFNVLIQDIVPLLFPVKDQFIIFRSFKNRLEQWFSLFEKASQEGLSEEKQRGLYGELYFLRKWLRISTYIEYPVKSWVGPLFAIRDFQHGKWALEVKTSHGKNHQKIYISNERQLDTTNLDTLILFHLSLEIRQQDGETLNNVVDNIAELLVQEQTALKEFQTKLLEAGYFPDHRNLYETTGYKIRKESFFSVKGDFPRIEEKDIRNGVGDISYSIILPDRDIYLIEEENVFKIITDNGNQHG